jgi:Ca2+-binding RTX toxin-like protein
VLASGLAGVSINNFESFDLSGFAGQVTLTGGSSNDVLIGGQGKASLNGYALIASFLTFILIAKTIAG